MKSGFFAVSIYFERTPQTGNFLVHLGEVNSVKITKDIFVILITANRYADEKIYTFFKLEFHLFMS